MSPWTEPETHVERCSRGEEVNVADRDNILQGGGKVFNRVTHRMIICERTGQEARTFQLTVREPWMCDDCNLVT